MKKLFLTVATIIVTLTISGQTTFEKTYDIYKSAFSDLVFSQDDGYLMAMVSQKDKYFLSLVKTDLNGDTLWTKDYDRGIEHLTNLSGTEDEDGNIYITTLYGNNDLIKLDKDGNILWAKEYTTMKREMVVHDNILWICGNADPGNYLFKIDATTGDSLWRSPLFQYDTLYINSSRATSITVTENGDVILTVSYNDIFEGYSLQSNFYRLPANTTELQQFTIQSDNEFVVLDSKSVGNDIISVAVKLNFSNNNSTCYLIRYSADGTVQLFKEEDFGYFAAAIHKCVITNDNQVVAMGNAITDHAPGKIMIHCFSMNGDSLWTQLLGNSFTIGSDLKIAGDNGFVITGGIDDEAIEDIPILIKTNSLGILNTIPDKFSTNDIQVYPNPATDYITFNTSEITNGTITILDQSGKVCAEAAITGKKTTLDTKHLKAGVYVYKVISGEKIISGKVVVKI